jgi:aminoglycoside phosphotransferase (APT) family kinase protein
MHADELEVDEALVRRLLAAQFPEWAELLLEVLPAGGTDNIYRLGHELSVRLPRRRDWASWSLDNEFEWLPKLAPLLPLRVPTPVARGAAGEGYPHEWAVSTGSTAKTRRACPSTSRSQRSTLRSSSQRCSASIRPQARFRQAAAARSARAIRPRAQELPRSPTRSIDATAVTAAWEVALAAPEWDRPPVWIHGDLDARNLLVRDGQITGLVDWGSVCVGDPACDVKVAWAVLDAQTRPILRELLEIDDATWARGRGWALSQAMIALPYYLHTYPVIVQEAWRWHAEALADS